MDQKLQLLKTVPLFAELDDRAIGVVGQLTEDVDVRAGHVLMRQGDRGDAFYVLVDGSAKIERDGKLLKTVGPGAYFGEIALLDHGVRTATVTTETPSIMDIAPTVLKYFGVQVPSDIDGKPVF